MPCTTVSPNPQFASIRTARGNFSQEGLRGFDLRGKTLGVIGTGDIGRHAATIARGFGMEVLAYDVKPDPALARELGFRYVDMNALLGAADVVTLHVPGGPATRHLLSTEQFDAMKPGVILINTARGNVVDIEALLHALAEGKVAAAGLDVLPEEPVIREEAELLRSYFAREHKLNTLLANHVLLRMRKVVITPHSAFNTREAVQRILDTTKQNIDAYLEGKPINLVA
ncbi:D-isomer specific 2-hydroxyacid dehydrogenase [Methylocaldum marinum]|uniref:D-isomer specific 2-hydroxyacid dehydrogenase n=1 Tax=Methylocaldum marinum TaxID=1432792 RepID=A0A250KMC0_9GAMM|nr:NAD(P)-dependent oxidoreductase [Methylocaldum marinum]BBA32702.1 D-isomer specific 2-hydroxyacid dehydrogenase [Methylocaldum marinum]